jgi:trk system potassium uptake protein TrkH
MALYSLTAGDGFADEFAESAAVTFLVAVACVLTTKGRRFELGFRDAAVLTVVAWGAVPAFAALPLLANPIGLSSVDAYFEMVSGITTTGSTVLVNLDTAPPTILLWRSTVQWIGGIGIIGIAILVLPFLRIGGMQLFRLESSDRSEKAIPRMRTVALTVGEIYLLLTAACLASYWLLGMTFFDAFNHALTTLATGGFSTHDASFGYFDSMGLQWAGTAFMTLAALPFLAYYRLLHHHSHQDRLDPQVVRFVVTLVILSFLFAIWLHAARGIDASEALTLSAFNIVSVVTTTGYASTNYLMWGAFAATLFFALTFVGGCTGSSTGAIKIFRFQVMAGMVLQHLRGVFHPHIVAPIRFGARTVTDAQVTSVGSFIFLYFLCFAAFTAILTTIGLDAETSLSAAATALGNVGPGLGPVIGPAGNFTSLPDSAKLVLCAAMIIGRLEIVGVLVLFQPGFYR